MTKRQNLDIRQGETFSWSFTFRDASGSAVDVSAYSARMAVRSDIFSADNVLFSSEAGESGLITLGSNGLVTLSMSATQTALMDEPSAFFRSEILGDDISFAEPDVEFVYDLLLTAPGGSATRAIEGHVTLHRAVTLP